MTAKRCFVRYKTRYFPGTIDLRFPSPVLLSAGSSYCYRSITDRIPESHYSPASLSSMGLNPKNIYTQTKVTGELFQGKALVITTCLVCIQKRKITTKNMKAEKFIKLIHKDLSSCSLYASWWKLCFWAETILDRRRRLLIEHCVLTPKISNIQKIGLISYGFVRIHTIST
jgi:hypothetical protein